MSTRMGKSRYIRRGYLTPSEQIQFETRASKWYFFTGPVVVFILLIIGDYWFVSGLVSTVPAIPLATRFLAQHLSGPGVGVFSRAGLAAIGVGFLNFLFVLWFLVRYVQWAEDSYAVTNDRLIKQHGRFTLLGWVYDDREIQIRQIRDLDVYQAKLWWKWFRIGTLNIHSLSEIQTPGAASRGGPRPDPYLNPRRSLPRKKPKRAKQGKPTTTAPTEGLADDTTYPDSIDSFPGVEWWFAIPNPIKAQRQIEESNEAIEQGNRPM